MLGLTIVPRIIKRINKSRFNIVAKQFPVGYAIAVLLGLLRGCRSAGGQPGICGLSRRFRRGAQEEKTVCRGARPSESFVRVFVPVYFAIVGLKLDLIRGVSLWMMAAFVVGTCVVKILSVSLAGRFAGFRGLDLINLAITTNARGGPGIVLASVAFDAGIISAKFYTTLVIAAVLTSQFAGAWLDYVLRKGWPLLSGSTAASRESGAEKETSMEIA